MLNILIIDDEPDLADAVAEMLRSVGHDVTTVDNGALALSAAREARPDLVITDILMPDMDGFEVIRAMRNECVDVPVLAMSGGGRLTTVEFVLDMAGALGACAVLEKPFSKRQLLNAVDICVGGSAPKLRAVR